VLTFKTPGFVRGGKVFSAFESTTVKHVFSLASHAIPLLG
jgi:hypothetical protein